MTQAIPDTDSLRVAVIAAALDLIKDQGYANLPHYERVKSFIIAYYTLIRLVETGDPETAFKQLAHTQELL